MGASNEMIARLYLSHLPSDEQAATFAAKEEAYRAGLGDLEPIAGAAALLDFADRRGLKRAVVTNAPRANAEKVLAALGIGGASSDLVIGAELRALEARSVALSDRARAYRRARKRSLAFEDSLFGRSLRSRRRARRGGHDDDARFANADRRRRDLRGRAISPIRESSR